MLSLNSIEDRKCMFAQQIFKTAPIWYLFVVFHFLFFFYARLKGHFGDLSVNPSGSFTVEKCFAASDLPLREAIVFELSSIETELSKTKQGPYLLKKLDVPGYVISFLLSFFQMPAYLLFFVFFLLKFSYCWMN